MLQTKTVVVVAVNKGDIMKKTKLIIIFLSGLFVISNAPTFSQTKKTRTTNKQEVRIEKFTEKLQKPKITFIELGSVNCIPCRMMQPVMKEIEKEYKDIVKVIFYDVWTREGSPYGQKYKIRAIPTQVFLDENGEEFFRHEGFFPKEKLKQVLDKKLKEEQDKKEKSKESK